MTMQLINQPETAVKQRDLKKDYYFMFLKYIDVKPCTRDTYKRGLKQFFIYMLKNGIDQPGRQDIINFRDYIKEIHKPGTAQTYLASVRAFFKWTEYEGLYPNITKDVKSVKIEQGFKKDYLTSAQSRQLLDTIDRTNETGLRDFAIVSLMLTTGLRTIEIQRAQIQDIRTLGDSTVLYVQGKGRDTKQEYVNITAPIEKAIRLYLTTRKGAQGTEPLFTSTSNNSKGKGLTTRSISGICKKYIRAIGLDSDRLTAHSLRHTAVTLALIQGNDITQVQQMARHSNINTTMIYNHALERAKNPCFESVTELLF